MSFSHASRPEKVSPNFCHRGSLPAHRPIARKRFREKRRTATIRADSRRGCNHSFKIV
jgi:hypothetical protein